MKPARKSEEQAPTSRVSGTHPSAPTYSFIDELRPSDLQLDDAPLALPRNVPPIELNLADVHLEDDDDDEGTLHDAPAEHDNRTIERYVPPSVQDLDYDSDQTTEVPSEWLDHLAASTRSERAEPVESMVVPAAGVRPQAGPRPSSMPTMPPPALLEAATFVVPPHAALPTIAAAPPAPAPMRVRSQPIAWNPTPAGRPVTSQVLLAAIAIILWAVLAAVTLKAFLS